MLRFDAITTIQAKNGFPVLGMKRGRKEQGAEKATRF
jgi:hypothetical protein